MSRIHRLAHGANLYIDGEYVGEIKGEFEVAGRVVEGSEWFYNEQRRAAKIMSREYLEGNSYSEELEEVTLGKGRR